MDAYVRKMPHLDYCIIRLPYSFQLIFVVLDMSAIVIIHA